MKRVTKKANTSEIQADILKSALASFRIEKIHISPEQATATMRKIETMLAKSPR